MQHYAVASCSAVLLTDAIRTTWSDILQVRSIDSAEDEGKRTICAMLRETR